MKISYGIDFGTTNSAAIMLQHEQQVKLGDPSSGKPLPSIVAIDKATGQLSGGRAVWETREQRIASGRDHVVTSVKRYLGTPMTWPTGVGQVKPEQVASEVIRQLAAQLTARHAPEMRNAAVTMPVGFTAAGRRALREAARLAGVEVSTFVHESTAALIRFLPQVGHCRHVAVFDWGGGTLDISVLRLEDKTVIELSARGMKLAGDDIDLELARAVHARECNRRGQSISFDEVPKRDQDRLRTVCETAKCDMETRAEREILLQDYGAPGKPLDVLLTRSMFDSLVTPFVDRAIEVLAQAVTSAGIRFDDLEALMVIGGTSRLRLLKLRLLEDDRFSSAIQQSPTPDWDVAIGAAIVDRSPGAYELSEAVGLMLADNSFHPLLWPRDRVNSHKSTVRLSLVEDSESANIILAKRPSVDSSTSFKAVEFHIPTSGFDGEAIDLTYTITPDLVLQLSATSSTRSHLDEVTHDYEELRFAYHIDDKL